jgi:hypothetical protein
MKKYIITDPCYIIARRDYDFIGEAFGWDNFDKMITPATLTYRNDKNRKITIIKISGTPHGDGSTEYDGQLIGVDAGMLCVAYSDKGWRAEIYGAKFNNEDEALAAFPRIKCRF